MTRLPSSRSLHGGVDRNSAATDAGHQSLSRSLHGGVDRNIIAEVIAAPQINVAPFTGAWIETSRRAWLSVRAAGRSLHGGVDRNTSAVARSQRDRVAPFTGAWIETSERRSGASTKRAASLPSRGVDRNAQLPGRSTCAQVAPFTGAWIETTWIDVVEPLQHLVAPFTGAWIETQDRQARCRCLRSLPSRGRGSKHRTDRLRSDAAMRRSLHGGVDRNLSS